MVIDEGSRHALFSRLEEVLGGEHASVLMSHLPPVGWADVATKHDLAQLREIIEARFETSEYRLLATFRSEVNKQTRTMVLGLATAFAGFAGVTLAATRLV